LAVFGLVASFESKVLKGREIGGGNKNHGSTLAAIPSIWSTTRYELFTPEAHASASTVSGDDFYFGFVDKSHGYSGFRNKKPGEQMLLPPGL
jgi:hypothetical protein